MLEAICVTDLNKDYIVNHIKGLNPRPVSNTIGDKLVIGHYVIVRKNDVVIWHPETFFTNYEFVDYQDSNRVEVFFAPIQLRRHEVKFCGDMMPHNTHGVTTGVKTYWCHGPTSIDVEWDVDINLPMYTRDYIRLNKTPHSPKE